MSPDPTAPVPTTQSGSPAAAVPGAPAGGATPAGGISKGTFWVAICVLVAFGAFTMWMTSQLGLSETKWSRLTYLYQGVEAIVFAAAGALFGTAVQRQNVQAAEKRENEAKNEADQSSAEAAAGRTVHAAITALQATGGPAQPPLGSDLIGASTLPHGSQDTGSLAFLDDLYKQALKRGGS